MKLLIINISRLLLVVGILSLSTIQLLAQNSNTKSPSERISSPFEVGLIGGFNTCQIHGDDAAGYRKFGLLGGLRSGIVIGKRTRILIDLLYSQRGSRRKADEGLQPLTYRFTLSTVEIPVQIAYTDWYDDAIGRYRVHVHAGLNYSRILNINIEDFVTYDAVKDEFANDVFAVTVGATFYVGEHFGLGMRYNNALTELFNNENHRNLKSLRELWWSFYGTYRF